MIATMVFDEFPTATIACSSLQLLLPYIVMNTPTAANIKGTTTDTTHTCTTTNNINITTTNNNDSTSTTTACISATT